MGIRLKNMKLQTKIFIIVTCMVIAIGGCIGVNGYFSIKGLATKEIGEKALYISTAAAASIEGDKIVEIINKDYYDDTCDKLNNILKETNCTYLYVITLTNDSEWMYIFDGTDRNSEDFSSLGDKDSFDSYPEEAVNCINKGQSSYTDIYEGGEWGYLTSGFSPVYNSRGEVVAIVGCDYSGSAVKEYTDNFMKQLLLITCIFLIICEIIFYIIMYRTFRPVKRIISDVNKLGKGDLTVSFIKGSKDEIGQINDVLCKMVESVKEMIIIMKTAAKDVAFSSEIIKDSLNDTTQAHYELSQTVETISLNVNAQAQDVETGYSGVLELSAKLIEVERNIEKFSKGINEINKEKNEGNESVEKLTEITEENNYLIDIVERDILMTGEISKEINEICKNIENIAKQTNLLALNASIEASRAGESGKGFTVIANEIRNLSEGSKYSTNKINEMAEKLGGNSKDTIEKMVLYKNSVETQTEQIVKTRNKFINISDSVDIMNRSLYELKESVGYIKGFKEQVVNMMEDLSEIAQNNAASIEEAAAAMGTQTSNMEQMENQGNTMNKLAEKLNQSVNFFKMI